MKRMHNGVAAVCHSSVLLTLAMVHTLSASANEFEERVKGYTKHEGFITVYVHPEKSEVLMDIEHLDSPFLYQVSIASGVGINGMELDRGELGDSAGGLVVFKRFGDKVALEKPNTLNRALTADAAEKQSVESSFASSVIFLFTITAAMDQHLLVDATEFFRRDEYRNGGATIAELLGSAGQGSKSPGYVLDKERSVLDCGRIKAFPKNTEVEALLTFSTSDRLDDDATIGDAIPEPRAISLRQRHSLVALPDLSGMRPYQPRKLDPRIGYFYTQFADFAAPFNAPLETRWIQRFTLQKAMPGEAMSEPVEPIVFYVDSGVPEVTRKSLIEGAMWWNSAFEAIGFKNALQVKPLPPGSDPMDLRFNMINWVHRATRGYSTGAVVVDPRTGQILKSTVTLDSSRARQDYLLVTGLIRPKHLHHGVHQRCEFAASDVSAYLSQPLAIADIDAVLMARVRLLAVHEMGHALGLRHNFAGSSYGFGSVMDYIAPHVEIKSGQLDLRHAYPQGIGAYDKVAIKYGYSQFEQNSAEGDELAKIVSEAIQSGLLFISDDDVGSPDRENTAAHPLASRYDSGSDSIASLRHELLVRRIGLDTFSIRNLDEGRPVSLLESQLLPLYLHHRYQLQAAMKSIGGIHYAYSVQGAGGPEPAQAVEVVPGPRQREALELVLDALAPAELTIPAHIARAIPPVAFGFHRGTAESFGKHTGHAFDELAPATIAADLVIVGLLDPARAARLDDYHARDAACPGFEAVISRLLERTWKTGLPSSPAERTVCQAVQGLVVTRLIQLAGNPAVRPSVRNVAAESLHDLSKYLSKAAATSLGDQAHVRANQRIIKQFLNRPFETYRQETPISTPPGAPIGELN